MNKDALGIRMKSYYEEVPKTKLVRRTPVIIRIDGRAFHTFTRHFDKPFDEALICAMQQTMKDLCEEIQGCVLGYAQSDEISLLLVDYATLESGAWFDYEVQKMCSIASSAATLFFNRNFSHRKDENPDLHHDICQAHALAQKAGAMFDARCFNLPKEEVTNYFYWRQVDAERNSIQMLAQSLFSQKQLDRKNRAAMVEMCETEHGIIWGNLETPKKRGSCCVKTEEGWTIDLDIPKFKDEGREYIERFVYLGEEQK